MNQCKIDLFQILDPECLTTINGIKFRRREIDIISFIISGRGTKKIADFFSLSPRTVENYIHNIMLKVECNSRESIINFIEKSDKSLLIKKYYSGLLLQHHFEQKIKENFIPDKESARCLVIYWHDEGKQTFLEQLGKTLKLAGIESYMLERREDSSLLDSVNHKDFGSLSNLIYIIPPKAEKERWTDAKKEKSDISLLAEKTQQASGKMIVLYQKEIDMAAIYQACPNMEYINYKEDKSYYFTILEILIKIFPNKDLPKKLSDFIEYYNSMTNTEDILRNFKEFHKENEVTRNTYGLTSPSSSAEGSGRNSIKSSYLTLFFNKLLKKKWLILTSFLITSIPYGWLLWMTETAARLEVTQTENTIRSELIIPIEESLLIRSQLMDKIKEGLKGAHDIQSIALVGIGGSGKTTLARQYGLLQNLPIVWEINSETRESLINSFENLLLHLARREEDKKTLKELQDIKDVSKREIRTLDFLKEKLKSHSSWLLIYDNFEDIEDLQQYLPNDPTIWGSGKFIVTTRDKNIANNKYINNIIDVKELNDQEKTLLFSKILANGTSVRLTTSQQDQVRIFLSKVPPFPLDIITASYYLKVTKISLEKYLEYLQLNDNIFLNLQENILKKAGKYGKTRYILVTLTLEDVIKLKKDFTSLLFFISLVDPHNVPRDLLKIYKGDVVVDELLYHLKKYSLINDDKSNWGESSTFAIHPTIQNICFDYLIKKLPKEDMGDLIAAMSSSLKNYTDMTIGSEDINKIRLLAKVLNKFFSHEVLLGNEAKFSLWVELGRTYFYLGNYIKAKKYLEEGKKLLNKYAHKNDLKAIHVLHYLGSVYRELGDYTKAKRLLDESFNKYRNYFPANYKDIAGNAAQLGNVYRSLGDYKKARNFLEESLGIYQKYLPQNPLDIAWASVQLASVDRSLGEYKQAQILLEKSLHIYKSLLSNNHIKTAWSQVHLANVYRNLGEYEKAKDLLQESLNVYKNHFSNSHLDIAWASIQLAKVYERLGDYKQSLHLLEGCLATYKKHFKEDHKKVAWIFLQAGMLHKSLEQYETAKDYLEKSLKVYEKHYGEMHPKIARILSLLGQIYLLKGNVEMAENLLQKALLIFVSFPHPDKIVTLEELGEISLKKLKNSINKGDIEQASGLTNKALKCFEEAREIARNTFGEESAQVKNLQAKLKALEAIQLG
jgi:tetratricopeptide (TPR) repeat protein/DNA-binding CsgD family transcriptional regulator